MGNVLFFPFVCLRFHLEMGKSLQSGSEKYVIKKGHKKEADDGNRTRLSSLGSSRSTDELHPLMIGLLYFTLIQ